MLSLLISSALCERSGYLHNTLASLPTIQQQVASNLAKAMGNVPHRLSYFVNNVQPVYPVRAQPEQIVAEDSADPIDYMPAPAALPEYNLPAWNDAGYNASNPWAAGCNALGYRWGQKGYNGDGGVAGYNGYLGGYMGDQMDMAYPGYGTNSEE